jgi:hypothetical protein
MVWPPWDKMDERDKAAAAQHVWYRQVQGKTRAIREFPPHYVAHPRLSALSNEAPDAACQHAVEVLGTSWSAACKRWGPDTMIELLHRAQQTAA